MHVYSMGTSGRVYRRCFYERDGYERVTHVLLIVKKFSKRCYYNVNRSQYKSLTEILKSLKNH